MNAPVAVDRVKFFERVQQTVLRKSVGYYSVNFIMMSFFTFIRLRRMKVKNLPTRVGETLSEAKGDTTTSGLTNY